MEILATIAYIFLVRLVFFEYKWLRFTLFWKFVVFGLYGLAALTEVILLCQFAPYTKEVYITNRVIPISSYLGGIVQEVTVEPYQPVKKGDPLFHLDPSRTQDKVNEISAKLSTARRKYEAYKKLVPKRLIALEEVAAEKDRVEELEAELAAKQFDLKHTVIYAPTDGYVVNMQLQPGTIIRMKTPVMTFVSTTETFIVGKFPQQGSQWIKPGNEAGVALDMYPGQVFPAEVINVIYAVGSAQAPMGGTIPDLEMLGGGEVFAVELGLKNPPSAKYPLRFGANGIGAIYTGHGPGFLAALRRIQLTSESFLKYVYNPF